MSTLEIHVLGPITASIDGVELCITKSRHREILGILVAAHGRRVSTDRLIDELWEDPPAGAVGAVRTFIGELRRILEPERLPRTPPATLVTTGDGYALKPDALTVDLWRAEHAAKAAAEADGSAREILLTASLDEWHGDAFEEYGTRPWAMSERAWIAEIRAGTTEKLADTRLALGRPHDVLTLLKAHTGQHPWRENGWRLLVLALYRCARQVEALAVLSQARQILLDNLGFSASQRLADLELQIRRQDPSLDKDDGGESLLVRTASVSAGAGTRSQIEGVTALLPLLAVSGSVAFAGEQRWSAIKAAEQFGDSELTARVIGGFDVPGSWTRSDDPEQSAMIVATALRTLATLPASASDRVRARLLATVAMESRGTADRLAEATAAENIARRLNDVSLLCFALSARYLQTFQTTGCASFRETIAAEIIATASAAELPTFVIQGRLIRMQALCALNELTAAAQEAALLDTLAVRLDRPLTSVFTHWFRYTFAEGPQPPDGEEMPGFRLGLRALAELTVAARSGHALPDGDFGPYEPWVRPLLLSRAGNLDEARAALDTFPDPPHDLMLEVSWSLIGLAAIDMGHVVAAQRSHAALLPAAAERAGGSAAVDLGPIAPLLSHLAKLTRQAVNSTGPT